MELQTNIVKTVRIVCFTCQAAGTQLGVAYKWRMKVEVISYRERKRLGLNCLEFGEEIAVGSLAVHQQTQHGKAVGGRFKGDTTAPVGYP